MITFVTLFLGLTWGPRTIEVLVPAPAAEVELLLDGTLAARDSEPPWSLECDLGDEPAPHLLEAVAYGADGEELGRARQSVNLALPRADAGIALERDADGRAEAVRLAWQTVHGASPSVVDVRFDGPAGSAARYSRRPRRRPTRPPAGHAVKLLAISDLHLGHEANRRALEELAHHPEDWLVVAGDLAEGEERLRWALERLTARFARVLWVPGNHDLWTPPAEAVTGPRGEERYRRLVEVCREHGVSTPEDPWPAWPGPGPRCRIALLFTLYDYTFSPDGMSPGQAIAWAAEAGLVCADELLLHPDPHPSRQEWCRLRCAESERRLATAAAEGPLVLVNHWPLRADLVHLPRIPRFSIWCGTRRSESWHARYRAVAAVHGHLHVRSTHWRDGVLFHEVSFGYPRDWDRARGLAPYLRQVLPPPRTPHGSTAG